MNDPLFWLGLSLAMVAASLTAVLVTALPALQELARAARSAEKLFDTLNRDFPPTLEAIRLTGLEISELTDDLNQGLKGAVELGQSVERGLHSAKTSLNVAERGSRRLAAGVKAAWQTWQTYPPKDPYA
ncbi:MAG: DUF948 domain-containing protein [Cyanobacteriota bacterium]|jgi:hypothetical protein